MTTPRLSTASARVNVKSMTPELRNRVIRRILESLHAFREEFGDDDTEIDADSLSMSKAAFGEVVDQLVRDGLVERTETGCVGTPKGFSLAGNADELAAAFPIDGSAEDPFPWEEEFFDGRSFERVENPPPATSTEDYLAYLNRTWPKLLNSDKQGDEATFQRFFERHPCLLPEPYGCFRRGATQLAGGIFTQPELPGFRAKRPDFMWITYDSTAVVVLLIEIEAPAKRWATNAGTPRAELTQATDQLRGWKAWFREPENVLQFKKLYSIEQRIMDTRQLMVRYALVYGRRAEVEANAVFAKKRLDIEKHDEVFMTYDRLVPSERVDNYPTLRLDRSAANTVVEVVHVPPTITLGPQNARQFAKWTKLREAVRANTLISSERRDFLIRRLDYWDEWVRNPPDYKRTGLRVDTPYCE